MKKFFYFLTVVCLMASCKPNNSYTISGTVFEGEEGDTVILFNSVDGTNQNIVQSAVIKEGKYSMTGSVDSIADIYFLAYEKGGLYMPIVLEAGEISAHLSGGNSSATGSINNDRIKMFNDSLSFYNEAMVELLSDTTKSDVEQMILQTQVTQFARDYIQKNIDNPAGLLILNSYYNIFSSAELDSLLQKVPQEYHKKLLYQMIRNLTDSHLATEIGKPYLDFEMNDAEGKPVLLSSLVKQNKVTLIDFWASWCAPCMQEIPNLVKLYKTYKNKGFGIVGISLDTDKTAWIDAVKEQKMTWPQLSDLQGGNSPAVSLYGFSSIPFTILIGQDGTIIGKELHGEELSKKIEESLQ